MLYVRGRQNHEKGEGSAWWNTKRRLTPVRLGYTSSHYPSSLLHIGNIQNFSHPRRDHERFRWKMWHVVRRMRWDGILLRREGTSERQPIYMYLCPEQKISTSTHSIPGESQSMRNSKLPSPDARRSSITPNAAPGPAHKHSRDWIT